MTHPAMVVSLPELLTEQFVPSTLAFNPRLGLGQKASKPGYRGLTTIVSGLQSALLEI